ncbi:hypothetical protein [Fibrella aquatilis]|uniref:Uncharacterized protein n=1 Tax=Fibrella aquatilis TaxID=2817059 RepID=A0A939G8F8_9BACT|nr:hypothetical protein [Fibrella aquatilis]MBO0932549.1 hypothetical protein [Fibrella aquatilis]
MDHQLSAIRQLRDSGVSIRDIADRLDIKKHEVEKAFITLKALGQRPDVDSGSEPDPWPDESASMYGHSPDRSNRVVPKAKAPKDRPSEWNSNCTQQEADFIISNHLEGFQPYEIGSVYREEWTDGFLALADIERVIDAYDKAQSRKKEAEAEKQRINDVRLIETFNHFIGEDALALLLWIHEIDEWDLSEVKACAARAGTVMAEIESFCRKHKLTYTDYEPYLVLRAIKAEVDAKARKRDDDVELDESSISFIGMLALRPNLDRYLYKLLEKSRNSYSRW